MVYRIVKSLDDVSVRERKPYRLSDDDAEAEAFRRGREQAEADELDDFVEDDDGEELYNRLLARAGDDDDRRRNVDLSQVEATALINELRKRGIL
jgi:hypothetical protein